ncbi:hypothetical protein Vretifemale_11217, partial [Volvox reticuliferus]
AVLQRQARVRNQVWKTIVAAQQTGLRVVREPVLRALNGGLQCQSRSAICLVLLQALLKTLQLLLLQLSIGLALRAGGQARDVRKSSRRRGKAHSCRKGGRCQNSADLSNRIVVLRLAGDADGPARRSSARSGRSPNRVAQSDGHI